VPIPVHQDPFDSTLPPTKIIENEGKCFSTDGGFEKQIDLVEVSKDRNFNPLKISATKLQMEYRNGQDPQRLGISSVTGSVLSLNGPTKGRITEERIWTVVSDGAIIKNIRSAVRPKRKIF
jgi:hypothetical protein